MDNIATELEALERVFSDESAEPIRLSYGLLRSVTDNFSKEIGCGGFGVVYMGYLGNGRVAVKNLLNPHALPDKQFLGEIMCLKKANHKNIVRLLGYCSETQGELLEFNGENVMAEVQKKLLCFEYVPNGNIRHYLQQEKPHGEDWPARYQMIIGICHGLLYLHEKHINHLDLKPENVMLDAQMEPKITDFGLSRFLDQGQSKMVTQHIIGTLRYVAPEVIDQGEISFKSDIYALGIIIIELLTGISMISLENWDESLDEDCPRARRCTEIARNCIDRHKQNRPTVWEVISDLDEMERMIPLSSLNKVTPTVFPGNEMFDVYPLELRFPFMPNREMHCHLSVTNKHTDDGICCIINPRVPDRYERLFSDILLPTSTTAITLRRKAEEELPSDTDEVEIVIMITGCDEKVIHQKMAMLPPNDGVTSFDDMLKAAHELLGFELHRTMLTAVIVATEDDDQTLVADTTSQGDETFWISSIDIHPMEPWVLSVQGREAVYVWNWQTNKKIGEYWPSVEIPEYHGDDFDGEHVAKFIPGKQWVVIGNSRGSILVRTCPSMDHVKEFKAHREPLTSLAVHSTRPLLLSCSDHSLSLKLWDWSRGWSCIGTFDLASHVGEIMFNPKHASTFATLNNDRIVEMWRIGQPDPVARTHKLDHFGSTHFFTYSGDQHFIAASNDELVCIWDLQSEKHIHTLHIEEGTVAIVCHPTHPVLVTASNDGSIRVWDSTTYRLKKGFANLPKDPIHIGFTASRRLVIGYIKGIIVLDIHLE